MEKHPNIKHKKLWKIVQIIIATILVIEAGRLSWDSFCCLELQKYIDEFEPVEYGADRKVPSYDAANGHYEISTEDGLKVMMLNDLHIGGGPFTKTKDRKAIYEVITMLQAEKPDLVILNGDNIFATPGPVFNGGGTFNNYMVERVVMEIFEHEQVYYSVTFGNHDTESFDFANRKMVGKLFESRTSAGGTNDYCIFISEFTDEENKMPSVTNQFIELKNADGEIVKLLMLFDSNDYINKSISASINWQYDTIHDAQIDWAKAEIESLSKASGLADGEYLDTIAFFHIPTGEFQAAYTDLEANNFNDTVNTKYLEGIWDEEINEELGIRIWFGGCSRYTENPEEADNFFETFGPDGMDCLEAIFCGHDHTNSAAVEYKGVQLVYGLSIDNTAYDDIASYGLQRGCTVLTFEEDGAMEWEHKNAYLDLGVDPNKLMEVNLTDLYMDGAVPEK